MEASDKIIRIYLGKIHFNCKETVKWFRDDDLEGQCNQRAFYGPEGFQIPIRCKNCKKEFETVHFNLQKDDVFYLFSDGYTDQFGGENVKKFNRQRFRNLLLSIHEMPFDKQKKELVFSYQNWKGKQEQVDDICVIGLGI